MPTKSIYLDYQATTPLDERVLAAMLPYFTEHFGNASSTDHDYGNETAKAIKRAAFQVAQLCGAVIRGQTHHPVIFTSGATESINLAMQGFALEQKKTGKTCRIGLMPIEHKAVLDTAKHLEKAGLAELDWLQIDSMGRLSLDKLESSLKNGLDLLVVMAAQNEIGTIYPLKQISELAQRFGTVFLCDASQAAGKIPLDFSNWGMDMLALTAHKFYGPKGSGALIVRKGLRLEPLIYGGGHQQGLRSGTLNVPAIVGLGEACSLRMAEMNLDEPRIAMLRDQLQVLLQAAIPDLYISGDLENRLTGNLHLCFPGIANDILLAHIRHKLAVSRGSACSSGVEAPSHVLQALGLSQTLMDGALRISLGKFTTQEEITEAASILIQAWNNLSSLV